MLKLGQSYFTDNIQLRYLNVKEDGLLLPLFAFVVSAKTEKLAVNRNLLKRRGRHILRDIGKSIGHNVACVFFFKKGAVQLKFEELRWQIVLLLKKAKLIG
ncbi:MAG: ribonuclease P protein component [Candidatus Vogelbacteria bacterium]|nr:ribonuclease P protein component [Candidatus Vogelbacteria bacterium]